MASASSPANAWRRCYRRAPDAIRDRQPSRGVSAAVGDDRKRRQDQQEFLRRNGFVGADAELANDLVVTLRTRRHRFPLSHLARRVAGQLAAVGDWNFQGVWRIAQLVGCHRRTVQRARKELERLGLLESVLLHAGDRLPSQRAPVWHLQVARDVRPLRGLVRRRARVSYAESMKPRPPPRPSAAAAPPPAGDRFTAADVEASIGRVPAWLRGILADLAAAKRQSTTPAPAPAPGAEQAEAPAAGGTPAADATDDPQPLQEPRGPP